MKTRKPKGAEPSLRAKLSAAFLEAFQSDFEAHGVEVIQKLRERSPEKYAELAGKLIMTTEPPGDGFNEMEEIGRKLLQSVGANELALTDDMIEQAIAANDTFIARLGQIAAGH